jgi:hypothetical protein
MLVGSKHVWELFDAVGRHFVCDPPRCGIAEGRLPVRVWLFVGDVNVEVLCCCCGATERASACVQAGGSQLPL